jgi:hypothetical protein
VSNPEERKVQRPVSLVGKSFMVQHIEVKAMRHGLGTINEPYINYVEVAIEVAVFDGVYDSHPAGFEKHVYGMSHDRAEELLKGLHDAIGGGT